MTISDKIEHIRAYALTCRASVINEDAMTAIELAGCTAKKVNEVVDLVNQLVDLVEKMAIVANINDYDESTETLIV